MRDVICDGFYEVWGDFPEIVERDEFPTLAALRHVKLFEGDPREVRRGAGRREGGAGAGGTRGIGRGRCAAAARRRHA